MTTSWERRHEAFKAIHDKIAEVLAKLGDVIIGDISKVVPPITVTTIDSNDKEIKDPAAGKKFRVKLVYVWNKSGADRNITGFKFGSNPYHFPSKIADKGGFALNLVGANFEGAADENFYVKADGANVVITVLGEEI